MGTEDYPHALPVASGLTEDEAEQMKILFGSHVHSGPLAGRYVYATLTKATDDEAVTVMCELRERIREQLERYRTRSTDG